MSKDETKKTEEVAVKTEKKAISRKEIKRRRLKSNQ